nr:hypothetical protein SBE_006619 [Streptomyces sp. SBE_14.2]
MITGIFGLPAATPTNTRLREVLSRAARVVIVEGPAHRVDGPGRTRATATDRQIADLGRLLAVVDGGRDNHCLCDGWPTIPPPTSSPR